MFLILFSILFVLLISIILTIIILKDAPNKYKAYALIPIVFIPLTFILPLIPFGLLIILIDGILYSWIMNKRAHYIANDGSPELADKYDNLL